MIIHKIDSQQELQTLVQNSYNKPIILHFYTDWCGPCKISEEELSYYATSFKDKAVFGKIDCDENEDILN